MCVGGGGGGGGGLEITPTIPTCNASYKCMQSTKEASVLFAGSILCNGPRTDYSLLVDVR